MNVYKELPEFYGKNFILRKVRTDDAQDLLRVYSDEKSVPLFNTDNCNGDDFHYTEFNRMRQALDFWKFSYENGYFVRWVIEEKNNGKAIGTIEMFRRESKADVFDNCGILRLDLKSEYETQGFITEILSSLIPVSFYMFGCDKIASKIPQFAKPRIKAFTSIGFIPEKSCLTGHDGTLYGDYYIIKK